MFENHIAS